MIKFTNVNGKQVELVFGDDGVKLPNGKIVSYSDVFKAIAISEGNDATTENVPIEGTDAN